MRASIPLHDSSPSPGPTSGVSRGLCLLYSLAINFCYWVCENTHCPSSSPCNRLITLFSFNWESLVIVTILTIKKNHIYTYDKKLTVPARVHRTTTCISEFGKSMSWTLVNGDLFWLRLKVVIYEPDVSISVK
jgi:hypothetical protein